MAKIERPEKPEEPKTQKEKRTYGSLAEFDREFFPKSLHRLADPSKGSSRVDARRVREALSGIRQVSRHPH
jgi:hypothetical protein